PVRLAVEILMSKEAHSRRTTNPSRRNLGRSDQGEPVPRLQLFLWAAAYVIVTTFSFAPTLSFRGLPMRAGSIATRDVVAPRDLIVTDPAATARRRTEAAAEVLPVYDWDSGATTRLEREIGASFRKAREASRRRGLSSAVRDAFDLPIGDEALAALARL